MSIPRMSLIIFTLVVGSSYSSVTFFPSRNIKALRYACSHRAFMNPGWSFQTDYTEIIRIDSTKYGGTGYDAKAWFTGTLIRIHESDAAGLDSAMNDTVSVNKGYYKEYSGVFAEVLDTTILKTTNPLSVGDTFLIIKNLIYGTADTASYLDQFIAFQNEKDTSLGGRSIKAMYGSYVYPSVNYFDERNVTVGDSVGILQIFTENVTSWTGFSDSKVLVSVETSTSVKSLPSIGQSAFRLRTETSIFYQPNGRICKKHAASQILIKNRAPSYLYFK